MKKLLLFFTVLIFISPKLFSQWTSISSFPSAYAKDIAVSGDTLFVATGGRESTFRLTEEQIGRK